MTSPGTMSVIEDALERAREGREGAAGGTTRGDGPSVLARIGLALEAERARWFYWVPVMIGAGIAAYFALPFEPPAAAAALVLLGLGALAVVMPRTMLVGVVMRALLFAALGFALITARTAWVAAPVLEQRLGPVEVRGYVELVEPREGRGERVTLRVIALGALAPEDLPARVRVRMEMPPGAFSPGDAIAVEAQLAPPAGPALPGGFDFARQAYFAGIGGVGYAVSAPVRVEDVAAPPVVLRLGAAVQRLRRAIGARVDAVLQGETAAIAKALVTGERGGIPEATNQAYRDSGLFHILSISGLHMAIMGGAVFWSVRLALALFPAVALRYPVKKWAALAAAAGSLGYLAISGTSFATVRSFIMISIMFMAILLDRPAIALRNVALSALVILVLFPESLLDIGFQMSFAAVVALVAAYEGVRDHYAGPHRRDYGVLMRVLLFFGGIVLSTLVASAAVTPFAIYHFHKSQQLAVLANLIAVPICNLVVMPGALATLVAMPLGLEAGPLMVMGAGVDAMSWTARQVAAMPGAVSMLPAIPTGAFALMVLGGLWLTLWHARWRLVGLAVIAAGIAAAPFGARPDLMVGRDGELVALRTPGGHLTALPAPNARYELSRWLAGDGDERSPEVAIATAGLECDTLGCTGAVRGTRIAVARHPAAIAEECAAADVLVLAVPAPGGCRQPAAVIDFPAVRSLGTHAVYIDGPRRLRIETVASSRGVRPWSPPHPWTDAGRALSAARAQAPDASRGISPGSAGGPLTRSASRGNRRQASRLGQFAAPLELLDTQRRPRPEIVDDDEAASAPVPNRD